MAIVLSKFEEQGKILYHKPYIIQSFTFSMHIHKLGNKSYIQGLPLAITIGNFDGLHLGHKYILDYVNAIAKNNNLNSGVLSFFPHPRDFLAKNKKKMIQIDNFYQKISKLLAYINIVFIAKFNDNLACLDARQFIQKLVGLKVKYIIVGNDFYFGHKRSYSALDLKNLALEYDIKVDILPILNDEIKKFSSSDVRLALQQADFIKVKQYLGENFCYTQKVSKGKQIGRTLGFRTINLKVVANFILPSGIYIVKVFLPLQNKLLMGIASLGYRPTINYNSQRNDLLLEVHILNWQGDLYGQRVKIIFLHKLREEKFYSSLEQMKLAIEQDIKNAEYYFNKEIL